MTNDPQSSAEELELAIKDQQQWCHCKGIVCHGCESIVGKMFKAGAEWQSARDQKTIEGLKAKLNKAIERINYYQYHNVACKYRLTYAHKFENADPCNCHLKDFIKEISS